MDSDRKKFEPWLARIFSRRHHKTPAIQDSGDTRRWRYKTLAIQDAGDEIKFP